MRLRRIILIILALASIAAAIIFRGQLLDLGRAAWAAGSNLIAAVSHQPSAISETLTASGTIEARTLDVASTGGGRIVVLHVTEGQAVAAGDLVAELDTSLLDAEIAQARAGRDVAAAQVALLRAGARPADLAVARAAVGQAAAGRDAAEVARADALTLVDAPGELDVQIAQANAALQAATEQVTAAQELAAAADLEQQLWARTVESLAKGFDVPSPVPGGGTIHVDAPAEKLAEARLQWNLSSQRTWEAHARHVSAIAARDAARQKLADLRSQRADPITLRDQADVAAAAVAVAAAAVTTAEANVAVLEAGVPAEQIAAAEALVAQADAAIAALEARRGQARVLAPEAGVVTGVVRRAGEVAPPAAPIVRLADLSQVTLTAYVPEPELGRVALAAAVQVTVDSFPDRIFRGTVTTIAGQAEFTPKNIQTRAERASTVFAVKIALPNPDAALKPGMPADATFCDPAAADCAPAAAQRQAQAPPASSGQPVAITASGAIEATAVSVAAELSGRVSEVAVGEGDDVAAGQAVIVLEKSDLAAQRGQAEAAVAAARAELAQITAPPQPARVAQAEAGVKQAEAALAAAKVALEAARTARDQPQALDAQINSARSQIKTATAAVDAARAGLKLAQVLQESLPNPGSDEEKTRRAMYDRNVAAAAAQLRAAEAQARGAQAALAQLQAVRANPVALDAAVHRAEGEVAKADAAVATARAALAQVQAPPQPEAVAVAQARVAQAEAGLALLDTTLARLTLHSPIAGTVTTQAIHAGEVAQAGAGLLTVTDLRHAKLVIYVPTGQIGQVRLGQTAEVTVDAYPGRTFAGQVARIADRAEFTPKNVQTQEERVKTVFAVEIALANEEGLLRPGMPADATLK